jgi:hypothetical protein
MNERQPVRIVYLPNPGRVFSPEELKEIFSKYAIGDVLELALRQIFSQRFASAAIDAAQINIPDRAAAHAAGRIQEVLDMRDELYSYFGVAVEATGDVKPRPMKRPRTPQ